MWIKKLHSPQAHLSMTSGSHSSGMNKPSGPPTIWGHGCRNTLGRGYQIVSVLQIICAPYHFSVTIIHPIINNIGNIGTVTCLKLGEKLTKLQSVPTTEGFAVLFTSITPRSLLGQTSSPASHLAWQGTLCNLILSPIVLIIFHTPLLGCCQKNPLCLEYVLGTSLF